VSFDIRPLTRAEAPLIADIITDAFDDDPLMLWIFGRASRARASYAAIARAIHLKVGFGDVAGGEEGGALWLPPGARDAAAGLPGLAIAARILAAGGLRSLWRARAASAAVLAHQPLEPHYYLYALGVRPAARRRGLGTALMAGPLARCDAEAVPACLESSKEENLPFYEGLGFRVTRAVAIPEGPTVWLMRRAPRAQRREAA
jgi:ribosomal protein S18 acetylase RimI-like enzyme